MQSWILRRQILPRERTFLELVAHSHVEPTGMVPLFRLDTYRHAGGIQAVTAPMIDYRFRDGPNHKAHGSPPIHPTVDGNVVVESVHVPVYAVLVGGPNVIFPNAPIAQALLEKRRTIFL